jgi:flagellar assembly protein FliH
MSDKQLSWQSWKPKNLKSEVEIRPMASAALQQKTENRLPPEYSEIDLLSLRQQVENEARMVGEKLGYEDGKKRGYQDGLDEGRKEGVMLGEEENRDVREKLAKRFNHLFYGVQNSLEDLDSLISARLVQLALTAARSIVGESLVYEPTVLLENIKHQLNNDFLLKGNLQLWVSSEDHDMIHKTLIPELAVKGWEIHSDPTMIPGGYRITSSEGEIDSTLSTRWDELCLRLRESTHP